MWEAEQVAKGWGDSLLFFMIWVISSCFFIYTTHHHIIINFVFSPSYCYELHTSSYFPQLTESLSVFDVDGEGWMPMSHFKWGLFEPTQNQLNLSAATFAIFFFLLLRNPKSDSYNPTPLAISRKTEDLFSINFLSQYICILALNLFLLLEASDLLPRVWGRPYTWPVWQSSLHCEGQPLICMI